MNEEVKRKMNDLFISEVEVIPTKPRQGLLGFASFVLNNSLYVGNVAIYSSPSTEDGYRLVFPEKILPNGKKIHCVHPITKEAGEYISKAVIKKFREIISKAIR